MTDPAELVNTARTFQPFPRPVFGPLVNDGDVSPGTEIQVVPPSRETCHWTVGVGVPDAAAEYVAVWPTVTV